MINVEAENVRLWVNPHERPDGSKWNTYAISTSSKTEQGDYVNKSLKVKMTRDVVIPEDLQSGQLVTIRGSLSNETYMNKNGEKRIEHILWAREVEFEVGQRPLPKSEPADSFEAMEEEIPF